MDELIAAITCFDDTFQKGITMLDNTLQRLVEAIYALE